MSSENGVIRIGKKGIRKFAFGAEGEPFEVDVVVALHEWILIDESFRDRSEDASVRMEDMHEYHLEAIKFAWRLSGGGVHVEGQPQDSLITITTAEALDFIARLREEYDAVADFFRPRSRPRQESPATSEPDSMRFSAEEA